MSKVYWPLNKDLKQVLSSGNTGFDSDGNYWCEGDPELLLSNKEVTFLHRQLKRYRKNNNVTEYAVNEN